MTEYLDPPDVEELLTSVGFRMRDRNLLLSALAAPQPIFGEEVHPGLSDKAAALLVAINRDHPLSDGNKRLAWIVAKGFLALNGRHLAVASVQDGDTFIRAVADGSVALPAVAEWIERRTSAL